MGCSQSWSSGRFCSFSTLNLDEESSSLTDTDGPSSHDIGIALAHEIQPFLGNGIEYDYHDPAILPFRISHNTPLIFNLASFAASAEALGLHPMTASILDDVRFLINAVMSLPDHPSPAELQKVSTTAAWMYERIRSLPEDSPDTKRLFEYGELTSQANLGGLSEDSPNPDSAKTAKAGTATSSNLPSCRRTTPESESRIQQRDDSGGGNASEVGSGRADGNHRVESSAKSKVPLPETLKVTSGPDYMYSVIRLAAMVNIRAIRDRIPLSRACSIDEFLQVWTTSWRVPLTTWRCALGIFNWAMFAIIPACHGGPHERFSRTMYMISMISRAAEDWGLMFAASRVAMRLQRWLAQGGKGGAPMGGGQAVARHGFLNTNWE